MGLMKKFFRSGAGEAVSTPAAASQFHEESQLHTQQPRSRNALRRDLVQTVLRSTMRKHGIPSDWVDCRTLKVVSQHKSGMHVQFLVRKADHQLLPYVHAFQESFREEIEQMDPDAREWLFSLGWEFHGKAADAGTGAKAAAVTHPGTAARSGAGTAPGTGRPVELSTEQSVVDDDDDELASDLQALQALVSTSNAKR